MNILYAKEAKENVETVGKRLEEAIKAHKFGIIAIIDLKNKMAEKGIEFRNACRIYEVCNPLQAKQVLEKDMSIATALPCRIAIYDEQGKVKVATMLPTQILGFFDVSDITPIAQEVESTLKAIIDQATQI